MLYFRNAVLQWFVHCEFKDVRAESLRAKITPV